MKIHIIGSTDFEAVLNCGKIVKAHGFEISDYANCDIAIAPYLTYKLRDELGLPKIGTLIFTNMLPAMITDELLLTFPSEFYLGDV